MKSKSDLLNIWLCCVFVGALHTSPTYSAWNGSKSTQTPHGIAWTAWTALTAWTAQTAQTLHRLATWTILGLHLLTHLLTS
jgi:hypothetical protein